MLTKNYVITCPVGLHARPASVLVTIAGTFKSTIRIRYKERDLPLNSIIGVMTLGAETGESVEITASGEDEEQVIKRLDNFFENEINDL